MARNYYAVKKGKTPGIYENWEACKTQVDGFPGAVYKGFRTREEAEDWLGIRHTLKEEKNRPAEKAGSGAPPADPSVKDRPQPAAGQAIAYVDGSYSEAAGRFSYGVVFFIKEEELHFSRSFQNPELLLMRNVAGEIMGAGQAMKEARARGCKHLLIYHDYEGIAKWCTGQWKTNKEWTKAYKRFYDEISDDVRIEFQKVKAHSKDRYNDLADALAKEALEITT